MDSGSLIVRGAITVVGDTVTAGTHSGTGTDGSAFGAGVFLQGNGAIRFSPGRGQTEHVLNAIDDQVGVEANGYLPPGGFTPGSYRLIKSGLGTLVLSADNAYTGGTTLKLGTLELAAVTAAGTGDITLAPNSHATLRIDNAAFSSDVFSNTIDSFGRHDILDLHGLHFRVGATAAYDNAIQQLSVHSGSVTDVLFMNSPHGTHFSVASDHHGGTDVFLLFA